MRRIFVNASIEHLRRNKVSTTGCAFIEHSLSDKRPSGLENLYNRDLLKATETLSLGYRTVFNLYAIEGYSHREIAHKLGITESTSKSQFSRAKAVLRAVVQ